MTKGYVNKEQCRENEVSRKDGGKDACSAEFPFSMVRPHTDLPSLLHTTCWISKARAPQVIDLLLWLDSVLLDTA